MKYYLMWDNVGNARIELRTGFGVVNRPCYVLDRKGIRYPSFLHVYRIGRKCVHRICVFTSALP